MTYRLAILTFPQTSARRDLHVLRPCTETCFPFSIGFGRSLWNHFQNDRFFPRPNFSGFVLIALSRVSIFIIMGTARCATQDRPRGLEWSLGCDAHRVITNSAVGKQATNRVKSLFVRVVSPRRPCVALKDVFTCYQTVSRSCKYDNLFNMQNVYFTEGPQTNWTNIYRERWPEKSAFFPHALLLAHSSSILLSKMLTRKLMHMEPWGRFHQNYI